MRVPVANLGKQIGKLNWVTPSLVEGVFYLESLSLSTEELYGLEAANAEIEKVSIQVGPMVKDKIKLEREEVGFNAI